MNRRLSVYELQEDGLVHVEGEAYELGSLQVAGQMIDIDHIVKTDSEAKFCYKLRTMACCNAKVKEDELLLVSDKYFIVPCYHCEVWSHWLKNKPKSTSKGMGGFLTGFKRRFLKW